MRKIKVFISGPMSGIPDFNRGEFFNAAQVLEGHGHIILNPAVLPLGLEHSDYMKICLPMIDAAEAVIMLPGWEKSKGANMEYQYAQIKRLPVFEAEFGYAAGDEARKAGIYDFGPEGITASTIVKPLNNYYLPALRLNVIATSNNPDAPNLSEWSTCERTSPNRRLRSCLPASRW